MTLFGNTNSSLLQLVQAGTGFLVTGDMLKMPLTNLHNTPWVVPDSLCAGLCWAPTSMQKLSQHHIFLALAVAGCVAPPPPTEHPIFSPTFYEFDLLGVFFTNIGLFGVLNSASLKLETSRWHYYHYYYFFFLNKRII